MFAFSRIFPEESIFSLGKKSFPGKLLVPREKKFSRKAFFPGYRKDKEFPPFCYTIKLLGMMVFGLFINFWLFATVLLVLWLIRIGFLVLWLFKIGFYYFGFLRLWPKVTPTGTWCALNMDVPLEYILKVVFCIFVTLA